MKAGFREFFNSISVINICRFVAKMFMWDWFTGMLNYLGKFCLFRWSVKSILTTHTIHVQWCSCYICTYSYIRAAVFKKHLKTNQLHWIFFFIHDIHFRFFFFKCCEFYFGFVNTWTHLSLLLSNILCHLLQFWYKAQFQFVLCVPTMDAMYMHLNCLWCARKVWHAYCILIWGSC